MSLWSRVWKRICKEETGWPGRKDVGGSFSWGWGWGTETSWGTRERGQECVCLGKMRKGAQRGAWDENVTVSLHRCREGLTGGWVKKPGEWDYSRSRILVSKNQKHWFAQSVSEGLQITLARPVLQSRFLFCFSRCWKFLMQHWPTQAEYQKTNVLSRGSQLGQLGSVHKHCWFSRLWRGGGGPQMAGMPRTTLQCSGQPSQQRTIQSKIPGVPRLRSSGIDLPIIFLLFASCPGDTRTSAHTQRIQESESVSWMSRFWTVIWTLGSDWIMTIITATNFECHVLGTILY